MKRVTSYLCVAMFAVIAVSMLPCAEAQTKATSNPCDLYTKADAEALFREKVSDGIVKKTAAPAGESCRYTFKKKGGTFGVTIKTATTPVIKQEGIFDSAKDIMARQKKARSSSEHAAKKFKAILGLGEDAFWSGTDLWVVKGETLAVITVHSVLEGGFKNRDALDAAHNEQNLTLSRKVAEVAISRVK